MTSNFSFTSSAEEIEHPAKGEADEENIALLCPPEYLARRVLGLFMKQASIKSSDVANLLGISTRQARSLLSRWVTQGWLEITDPSRRGQKYKLALEYRGFLIEEI